MKVYEMEQQTPEWFAIRNFKMTASHASEIATAGKGLDTYINEIVAEGFSYNKEEKFSNRDMERGKVLEADAVSIYELEKGVEIKKVGFIEHNQYSGCSPDGLIKDDGGIEIKSPKASVYTKVIIDKEIDKDYLWQSQMNLFITQRRWWDLVFYNPMFKVNMFIMRVYPDLAMIEKLKLGLAVGQAKLKDRIQRAKSFLGE